MPERRSGQGVVVTHGATTDGGPVTVFVSDPSAEAERIAQALRAANYTVVDVPLSMLVARVAVQRPKVILLDADAEGAIDVVGRVRELPDSDDVDVVFLHKRGEPLSEDARREASGVFDRPVDERELVAKIESLTGGRPPPPRAGKTPSSVPPPPSRPSPVSLPPPSMRAPESFRPPPRSPLPKAGPFLGGPIGVELAPAPLRRGPSAAPLSEELEALLDEAEQRIGVQLGAETLLPSPEEEIEAVLPAEVLASLDEPLEDEEEDDLGEAPLGAHFRALTTGAGGGASTGGGDGTGAGSTGAGGPTSTHAPVAPAAGSARDLHAAHPADAAYGTHGGSVVASLTTGSTPARTSEVERRADLRVAEPSAPSLSPSPPIAPSSAPIVAASKGPPASVGALPPPPIARVAVAIPGVPGVLGDGDAARILAAAVATRTTAVLAFDGGGVVRRAVLREGDLVTAASSSDDEGLLAFLAARGELPRDRAEQLSGKMPPFGRHAGAALVAHGYLRQDQLWGVLRSHAEWVLGRILTLDRGTVAAEGDAPGRLRNEPSVFGGSTGAEVVVEAVRRVVSPARAIARMGGESSRLADGPNGALLSECALTPHEVAWIARVRGGTLGDALSGAHEADLASVAYALSLLGVIEVIRSVASVRAPRPIAEPPASRDVDALDDEAIRARVRARLQLVDEGDYFAVLGVPRDATGYEVKRAYLELRRAFEPSRILTPTLADLRDDVEKIASVLDEAYDVLRDGARRERYRRAIEAMPRA